MNIQPINMPQGVCSRGEQDSIVFDGDVCRNESSAPKTQKPHLLSPLPTLATSMSCASANYDKERIFSRFISKARYNILRMNDMSFPMGKKCLTKLCLQHPPFKLPPELPVGTKTSVISDSLFPSGGETHLTQTSHPQGQTVKVKAFI